MLHYSVNKHPFLFYRTLFCESFRGTKMFRHLDCFCGWTIQWITSRVGLNKPYIFLHLYASCFVRDEHTDIFSWKGRNLTPVWSSWSLSPFACTKFKMTVKLCGPTVQANGYRVFPGGKERPERDADPSPPSSAVVMKE